MSQRALPIPNANVVMTELDDSTGVLLNLDTKIYFTLNATGVFVWKTIAREPKLDLAELTSRIVVEFDVEAEQAERDLVAMIEDLVVEGLVRTRGGA